MNQLGKVAMCVVGLTLGSVVCAARVQVGITGLYITLPTYFKVETKALKGENVLVGRGDKDFGVVIHYARVPVNLQQDS